ncbi:hypothetical protein L3X38_020881 [Prunus dulcis]|uniref:Uncharacterized protein n=1 Tax=Prunus dulcis TaxID=3755 RepID=A0AAD4VT10_PRUDU|nr:hypothetical protein L3X38_020881 [Prunus dulcis]
MCASDAPCALLSSHLSPLALPPPITAVCHRSPPLITLHHNTHGFSLKALSGRESWSRRRPKLRSKKALRVWHFFYLCKRIISAV